MPVSPTLGDTAQTGYLLKDRRFGDLYLPLVLVTLALTVFGLVIVHSAIQGSNEYSFSRQALGVVMGIALCVIIWRFDYRKLTGLVIPLLVIDVLLILSPHLPLIGVTHAGAASWIKIGIQLQPGEFAKVVSIIMIAALVARYRGAIISGKEYLKVLLISAVPFICIMTQPDLGTGLVLLTIAAVILFAGGANRKYVLITVAIMAVAIALVLMLDPIFDQMAGEDVFMKDYQMNRLLVFLDDSIDPTGVGYNLKQAKIAVGSGGFLGKGLGQGTQSTLGFLPEAATDFIFCVLAEETGFVGATLLLALYGGLFYCAFKVAHRSSDLFGSLIAYGIAGMWVFQIFENIGMTIGLMPITGIPLPFISYGSSFMLVNFMAVGLLLAIWRQRKPV